MIDDVDYHYETMEDDGEPFEDDLKVTDDSEFPAGSFIKVDAYGGVAWVVRHINYDNRVVCHMVGDDREFNFDRGECHRIPREDFCGQCGQIGCSHDGLERES